MTNPEGIRHLKSVGRFDWERIFERVPTGPLGIKPTTKYVGWVLARYSTAETGGQIHPGRERLATVIGKSVRTIDGALDELCDVGLLELVRKGGRGAGGRGFATEYRLTLPSDLSDRMTLLDLHSDDLPSIDHSQPTASDDRGANADQSQSTASDQSDHSQLSTPSLAVLGSTTRSGLHPTNHLHQSIFTNQEPVSPPNRNVSRASADKREGEEALILKDLAGAGLDDDEANSVLSHALDDSTTTTTPRRRLQLPAYLAHCRDAVKAQRRSVFEAGAKCEDHPTEAAANCRSCQADRKVGERDLRYVGKHQPQCSVCLAPLVGYPTGARTCNGCAEVKSA
ncbi:Uncharacterised protein [Arthrobacter agilis]|uniref:helix-turn-helix domain-containing protein n=1 Tax=Arthrobacter agilis TaxID=37921 RepID=UPI000F71A9BE|nr:Uncharacterised protein [Arthrobacter agilis]